MLGQTLPDGPRLVRRLPSPRAWLAVYPDAPQRPLLVREPALRPGEVVFSPPDQVYTWFDGAPALAWRLDGATLLCERVGPLPIAEVAELLAALETAAIHSFLRGTARLDPELMLWGGGRLRILPQTRYGCTDVADLAALLSWWLPPSVAGALDGRLVARPLSEVQPGFFSGALRAPDPGGEASAATIAGVSVTGLERRVNEDGLLWVDNASWRLVAVADGMGGNITGEGAARAALVEMMRAVEPAPSGDAEARLRAALERARVEVERNEHCGTTLVCALIGDGVAHVLHIGDSLAWRVTRAGGVTRLTEPHTLGSLMLRAGRDPSDPQFTKVQHILVRSLIAPSGKVDGRDMPDYACVPLSAGDQILLATDGLWSVVSDDTIGEILSNVQSARAGVAALLRAAYDAGAPDNVTIALFGPP